MRLNYRFLHLLTVFGAIFLIVFYLVYKDCDLKVKGLRRFLTLVNVTLVLLNI